MTKNPPPPRKRVSPLPADVRVELAKLLDREGFRTVSVRSGTSTGTLKRARDGEGMTAALVTALTVLVQSP